MGVQSGVPQQSSFTSSKPSEFTSFIAAFIQRSDDGSSLSSIKRALRNDIIPASGPAPALTFKCRRESSEVPCVFAAHDDMQFSASVTGTPTTDCCTSASSQVPAKLCQSCSTSSSASSPETTSEEPSDASKDFASFTCGAISSPVCLDGQCYDHLPIYRAARPRYPGLSTRSSLAAGGGDAFDDYSKVALTSRADHGIFDDYEQVAIIDTGANKHWFGDRADIFNRRPADFRTTTADGSQIRVTKQGDYQLYCKDENGKDINPLLLKDVSILPGSPINLVSVGVMCNEGSIFHFEQGNSYLEHQGRRIRLIERNGLYLLRLDEVLSSSEIGQLRDCEAHLGNARDTEFRSKLGRTYACAASWDLWHERFGHASKKRLKFIFDNGSSEGMAVEGQKFKHNAKCTCPTCLSVNNAKVHIGDVRQFADSITQKGQLVLTDICGPFPASVEGYRYVISFTDVYSRFSACYMLKKKSDSEAALEALVLYFARNGIIIREIRSDQGGEFGGHVQVSSVSGEGGTITEEEQRFFFKRVCEKHNILHVPTPAHRPELHGLAERWNLTVMKMANAMLFSARLSHILWPSAVAHANMLRNRLPIRGLGPYTPYELFTGKRPRIDQLRVFGCDAYKLLPTYPKIPGQIARKRLIYCGETADRIGYRCFDPVTYRFSTEFELIFDEQSAKKRINSLYEHDTRRALQQRGQLSKLPLQADNYAVYDASQQAVRNVFSSPSTSPHILSSSGGVGADTVPKDGASSDDSTPKPFVSETGSIVSPTSALAQPDSSAATESRNIIGRTSTLSHQGSQNLADETSENAPSSIHHHRAASRMGSEAALQKPQSGSKRDTVPTTTEECDDDGVPEEFKIHGQSLRPGPLPGLRPRKSNINYDLRDIDAAPILLNDAEAQQHGPLTEQSLEAEHRRSQQDPQQPRRPLRHLPIGQIERDSAEFKAFRKYAFDFNVLIKLVDNPKKPGSESFKRYARYQPATTLRQLVELSATSSKPAERVKQAKKAHDDITNDSLRGFILFPQHEHNASAHFVNASRLAHQLNTINVHVAYSSIAPTVSDTTSAAYVANEGSEDAQVEPSSFHDQIRSLWECDRTLQLNESEIKQESLFAASTIKDLVTGDVPEPETYRKVSTHPEREQWIESMARERATLEQRGTWELVPRNSIGKHRPVKCKYVFRKKLLKDFSLQFKSRLVACGYSQIAGLDYASDETYAGVCSYSSMRFLMSLVCQKGYILSQADITGAYLESYLHDEIYMEPPPDMRDPDGGPLRDAQGRELVCKLKRGLYGLKQSGRAWSECFKEFLLHDKLYNMGFVEFTGEPNMYRKVFELNGKMEEIILGVYVDDILIGSSSEAARLWFMQRLEKRFPVNEKSTGVITVASPGLVLSMHVRYNREHGILQLDQRSAIRSLAAKYSVLDLPPKSMPITPAVKLPKLEHATVDPNQYLSVVGSCLHLSQVSRPDIAYAIGVLSRHSATPGLEHMGAAINVVNYLNYTQELCIQYTRNSRGNNPEVFEKDWSVHKSIEERLLPGVPESQPHSPDMFVDADYAGDLNTRRSTSGMVVMMNQGPISWLSRIQKLCAQSSAESEIYAVTDSVKEAIHIKLLCEEAGIRNPDKPLVIWEDNTGCIHLGHGLRGSKAAKHFETRLRFLNEQIHSRVIEFAKIDTKNQIADGFTKALPGPAFFAFRDLLLHSHGP